MTMIRTATAVVACYATAEAGSAAPKGAAVNKVVDLITSLREKIKQEHEEEAKAYDKFSCWCKDTVSKKSQVINDEQSNVDSQGSEIETLSADRLETVSTIQQDEQSIKDQSEALKIKKQDRLKAEKKYRKQLADHNSALTALHQAVQSLKASKAASFVQVPTTLRSALAFADAMGMLDNIPKKTVALLQKVPAEINMEDYKFKSGDVITTLKTLSDTVVERKTSLNEAEQKEADDHDIFVQETHAEIKRLERKVADAKGLLGEQVSEMQSLSKSRTSKAALIRQEKDELNAVKTRCIGAKETYDSRSHHRSDEVTALTSVLTILKESVSGKVDSVLRLSQQPVSVKIAERVARDPVAMSAIEAAAESVEAVSFAQTEMLAQVHRSLRGSDPLTGDAASAIVDLLMTRGRELKSLALTSLAGKVTALTGNASGGDPLAKVKTLIEELILRLKKEDNKAVNQKAWCDKSTADAELERNAAVKESRLLNTRLAKSHARKTSEEREVQELEAEKAATEKELAGAQAQRTEESEENAAAVQDAEAGLVALQHCVDILTSFADKVKKDNESFDGGSTASTKFSKDVPDAGFKNGEMYQGAQGEHTGIMAMLEVIGTDFKRTISETKKTEEQAQTDFLNLKNKMTITTQTLDTTITDLGTSVDDLKLKITDDEAALERETDLLVRKLEELTALHNSCVDTGMSYEERVAMREQEIESLKKAVCILKNHKNPQAVDC